MQFAALAFGAEGLFDQAADQLAHAGHARGQVLRGGLERDIGGDELRQQLRDFGRGVGIPADAAVPAGTRQPRGQAQRAVQVPAELQVIGEYQVAQRFPIASELLGSLGATQVDADILCLHIAQRHHAAGDDEIRRAAIDLFGFVDGADVLAADGFQQRLQRGPMGMLGGVAGLERLLDGGKVGFQGVGEIGGHPVPCWRRACAADAKAPPALL